MKKKTILISVIICIVFVTGFVSYNTSGVWSAHATDSIYLENQKPITGDVPIEYRNQINSLGLNTSGNVKMIFETTDYWGRTQIACADESYTYTFNGYNGKLISAYMNGDCLEALTTTQEKLTEVKYIELARYYISAGFRSFNPETTIYKCEIGHNEEDFLNGAYVQVYDRQGNVIVNSGVVIFSQNGTLTYVGGTNNSIEDFNNSDNFSMDTIKQMVFELLVEYNDIVKAEGLPTANEPEKPLGEFIGDENDLFDENEGIEGVDMPSFELYLNSIEDIRFERAEKEKYGDSIAWMVLAQVKTSWGELDPTLNFIYAFTIDANSGKVISTDILTGS